MPRSPGHLPIVGLWLLAATLVVRFTILVLAAIGEPAHGFVAHYTASRLVVERADVASFYSDSLFIASVQRYEPGVVDIYGANPPTVAVAVLPLVAFDYDTARTIWTIASLLAWLLATLWLARTLELGGIWPPVFLCVATLFQPALEHMRHGQLHVLVLVFVLIAWNGLRRERPSAVGKGLGLALSLKVAGMAFWPLLVVRRQWRAIAWGATTILAFVVLSGVMMGIGAWTAFIERAGDTAAGGSLSVTAYQTLPGLVRRLTVADPRWNPSPLFDLGSAGVALSSAAVLAVLGYSLFAARTLDMPLAFAAFAAIGLAISPVSLDYHYVLAILPAAILISVHRDRILSPAGLLVFGAIAMIALDLPYRSDRLAHGALAVVAYPKLYGALILSWLLLHERRRRPGHVSNAEHDD